MVSEFQNFNTEIEEALKSLFIEQGSETVDKIRAIIYSNLKKGRLQVYVNGEIKGTKDYVWLVAEKYKEMNSFMNDLQVAKITTLWEPLFKKLESWAYNYFVRKSFYADEQTKEIALECASEAVINILRAQFPYDTEFEPWARVIVTHSCQKYIERATKSGIPQQNIIPIDDQKNDIEDMTIQPLEQQQILRGDLIAALGKLPKARRQIIEFIYFDGLSPNEIADRIGKSVGAVYSLHFNALLDLRNILDEARDKPNE